MKATRTYGEITARPISVKVHEWLVELVDRFGDDETCAAIIVEAAKDKPMGSLLGRVRDRLAGSAAQHCAAHPTHVERDWFLGIVRDELRPPDGPWTYDCRDLSRDEYDEALVWAARKYGADPTPHALAREARP